MENPSSRERIKFYGLGDLANGWFAEPALALLYEFASRHQSLSLNDALELHNALAFEEHNVFPHSLGQQERKDLSQTAHGLRKQVASFFSSINKSNLQLHLGGLDYEYAEDLIVLLERHNLAKKCGADTLFDALVNAQIPLTVMLSNAKFVERNNYRLCAALLADAQNGELLIQMRITKGSGSLYCLPRNFGSNESQQLLSAYIDSPYPHLNYVQAIAVAKDDAGSGITPKIRLQAKKRYEELSKELFRDNKNVQRTHRYGVHIDPKQRKPVLDRVDRDENGMTHIRSFGEQYLLSSMEPQRVLRNLSRMVGYLDGHGLLTMPSFKAQLGVLLDSFVSGKAAYPRGSTFDSNDSLTLLGTQCYSEFLLQHGVEIEAVIAWFFREHLADKFGAPNFYYAPSSSNSSFLERCRHVAAEMEGIAKQFTLYCEEGELDLELLRMTSAPRPWADIPSLNDNKYLFAVTNSECDRALHLLFSDQSGLTYINSELRAKSFVQLATENELLYSEVHHYQKNLIDWLISNELIRIDSGVIEFAQPVQILVLSDVHKHEAAALGHYGNDEFSAAFALVDKKWLEFSPTLLTSAEASYFNYFLNKSEFSDGPDLRNKYVHGTNADPDNVDSHRQSYWQLVRMLISLTLKIGDDFQVSVAERSHSLP